MKKTKNILRKTPVRTMWARIKRAIAWNYLFYEMRLQGGGSYKKNSLSHFVHCAIR